MKFSVVLCLLAVVLIQQCMSARIARGGEDYSKDNDDDHKTHMSHERGDHTGHKHDDCDHPDHKHEDHTGHKHKFGDHTAHYLEDHRITHHLRLGHHH